MFFKGKTPRKGTGIVGQPSHTAVCIDIGGLIGPNIFPERISEMIDRMKKRADNLKIPNERASAFKHKALADQSVDVDDALISRLNIWCDQFAIPQLKI
jgi:LDH2 family malate/lactate/ureidoglycolate dehydrogenase